MKRCNLQFITLTKQLKIIVGQTNYHDWTILMSPAGKTCLIINWTKNVHYLCVFQHFFGSYQKGQKIWIKNMNQIKWLRLLKKMTYKKWKNVSLAMATSMHWQKYRDFSFRNNAKSLPNVSPIYYHKTSTKI